MKVAVVGATQKQMQDNHLTFELAFASLYGFELFELK